MKPTSTAHASVSVQLRTTAVGREPNALLMRTECGVGVGGFTAGRAGVAAVDSVKQTAQCSALPARRRTFGCAARSIRRWWH
jgi:hypothetical protein